MKLKAAAALAVPMGFGAMLGAPVGALVGAKVGAKVGAVKGALLVKGAVLKKLGLVAGAAKKAVEPIIFLAASKKALLAQKASLLNQKVHSVQQKSSDFFNDFKTPITKDYQIAQVYE